MRKQKHTKSAREIKEDKVSSLIQKINDAKTLTFADYRGLGANQIATLRDKIKAVGGELIIEKNSLLKIALSQTGRKVEDQSLLTGPTAAIFSFQDEVGAIKETAANAKESGLPSFKFGYFGNEYLDTSKIDILSMIPTTDVLKGKIVSTLSSPLYGIVGVLGANLRNLVYALASIKIRKAGE